MIAFQLAASESHQRTALNGALHIMVRRRQKHTKYGKMSAWVSEAIYSVVNAEVEIRNQVGTGGGDGPAAPAAAFDGNADAAPQEKAVSTGVTGSREHSGAEVWRRDDEQAKRAYKHPFARNLASRKYHSHIWPFSRAVEKMNVSRDN